MKPLTPKLSDQERYLRVQKELQGLSLEPNDLFTEEQFYQVLDSRMQGRKFDRTVAQELFDRMKKETREHILIDEFIRVYIEAYDYLTENLEQANIFLEEYNNAKADVIHKLEDLKREEVLSQYNIMQGSVLALQVLELSGLDKQFSNEVYAVVNCGEISYSTKVMKYLGAAQWHEQFNIDIKTGKEVVLLHIVTLVNKQEFLLGKVTVPISKLADQFFRDEQWELRDNKDNVAPGKVHLKLQWIHSRVKYMTNVLQMWDKKIKSLWEDRKYFEQTLATLKEIFPRLVI